MIYVLGMCEFGSANSAATDSQEMLLGMHRPDSLLPDSTFRLSGGEKADLVETLVAAVAVWADYPNSGEVLDSPHIPSGLIARVCATYAARGDDKEAYEDLRAKVPPEVPMCVVPFAPRAREE